MKYFLLTLDYELFGNGSGDVFKHIIEPTKRILAIAEQYNAKITFFFEVVEYWKLKEEWDKGNNMGYKENPILAMENQIKEAYSQGHDVQLHLHPQWVDAYWENGKWLVNLDDWRLGGYQKEGEYSLVNLFKRGKRTLEALLQTIDPSYRCFAVRAGGYNIQPSKDIVNAMKETGIFVDSSIYPGGKETGMLSNYDYSVVDPTLGMWKVGERLEERGDSDIIELPIVAFPMMRLKKFLTWERLKGFLSNVKSAKDSLEAKTSSIENKSSKLDKLRYFFQTEWQTWDYCLFSHYQHKSFLKQISVQDRNVFVMVGHPKSFTSAGGLEFLLKQSQNKYEYKTISEVWAISE